MLDNNGKQYELNIGKLMRDKSIECIEGDEDGVPTLEERTFFCSELVAKAFKEVGILENVDSSTKFRPGTFSQKW